MVACVDRITVGNVTGARRGGAVALWDALARDGWSAPAHDVFKVRGGHLLRFGSGCIEEGTGDYEQAVLVDSLGARGLADVKGLRG